MKTEFSGWYMRAPDELDYLWENAIFVPDANVLLHCIRLSLEVREELLQIFEAMQETLWIPYQIGFEFHKNRLEVEANSHEVYDTLIKAYEDSFKQLNERLRGLRSHPGINVDKELHALDVFMQDFRERTLQAKDQHPSSAAAQALERITKIFQNRVGEKPTKQRLDEIVKDGESRYAKRIPPGYMDAKKNGLNNEKFGDLIVWFELIHKAKTANKPIIFISDDAKEDWWYIHRGKKLGPRPELREEFKESTNQEFHLYELGAFLRFAATKITSIDEKAIDSIEESIRDENQSKPSDEEVRDVQELLSELVEIEGERDTLISMLTSAHGDLILTSSGERKLAVSSKDVLKSNLKELDKKIYELQKALYKSDYDTRKDS